jgi:hypothetical protein
MGICRVQKPAASGIRAFLDGEADELDAEPAAPVLRKHEDVRQVDEPCVGRVDGAGVADETAVGGVEADVP